MNILDFEKYLKGMLQVCETQLKSNTDQTECAFWWTLIVSYNGVIENFNELKNNNEKEAENRYKNALLSFAGEECIDNTEEYEKWFLTQYDFNVLNGIKIAVGLEFDN